MDRNFGITAGIGAAVVLVGIGALWGAANQWTSFSDWWLHGPAIGAMVVVVMAAEALAKRAQPEGGWPLPVARRLPYLGLCAALGVGATYVAYWVVTLAWEPDRASGGALALLFEPGQFMTLYTSREGRTSGGMGVMGSMSIMAGVGLLLPALWMRRR
jgi:hypothetical protein